jgi:cytochrome c-type biogenesis protein CcmH
MKKRWWIAGAGVAVLGVAGTMMAAAGHKPATAALGAPSAMVFVDPPKVPGIDEAAAQARAKAKPGDADSWVLLGDVQLRTRKFRDAEASYVRALAIDPKRSATWSALGEARMQIEPARDARLPAGAAEAFDRTLALDPRDLRARFYRTMERDFLGQHDAAIGAWLAMLREVPMGSDADESIRVAITASVRRNQRLIAEDMRKATAVQPHYRQPGPEKAQAN